MTVVTAVTDKALLREREGGPNLGGEMGTLALGGRGGITWSIENGNNGYGGGCRVRLRWHSPQASKTKDSKIGNSILHPTVSFFFSFFSLTFISLQ